MCRNIELLGPNLQGSLYPIKLIILTFNVWSFLRMFKIYVDSESKSRKGYTEWGKKNHYRLFAILISS
jgi:hypothetical protein